MVWDLWEIARFLLPFLLKTCAWTARHGEQAAPMVFWTCTKGQSDRLGEYRTFKESLGGGKRGLLERAKSDA
jgi:hypothetical protein